MTGTFTDLYERARKKERFGFLYDLITSRENILLAFRTIKSNKGSQTAGTDRKTIADLKVLTDEELVNVVRDKLLNYRPKQVRRVFIPKPNGKLRPLGIPCMLDRVIQQSFKQILEPIAEAHFYRHSYGFRPLRSAHHALARSQYLVNRIGLHYVVDVDVQGFFDNVNHTLLIKQLWNLGIQDRKVLRIISKMLKAEIEGEGKPSKGTPQGGILSPLLSNIVLHDLDQWIAGQWEEFATVYPYSTSTNKNKALKKTRLKEGYLVRYADDFKIFCRDWRTAQKWYVAVRLYLKERLKLELSPDKSKIVNLRKRPSEFLGFTIRAVKKGDIRVAHTGINRKKKTQIKMMAKKHIRLMRRRPTARNANLYNSFVLGIHNYFKRATLVNLEFSRLAYDLRTFTYNRLKQVGKYEHPSNPPPTYTKWYNVNYRTFNVGGVYLYPIKDVQMVINSYQFKQELTPFTQEGREEIHQKLKPHLQVEIVRLMTSYIPNCSVEYLDNRISRYSMKLGRCEITGSFLYADEVHCHHYLPVSLGGTDRFSNLRILHKDVHTLIHAKKQETIIALMTGLGMTEQMVNMINQYRKMSNLELINEVI
ncbi:group II intron reverse transcriptase/maturase [Paenibacillus odorifer]|nr:group II intron reverse transcriptase/maturase [Paenibacillus odorifer]OME05287.1 group II intron reverse transcriptase/maturase [Paenibacillus odorifer]OMF86084.1 group II intron reverse transcriptase/maturase [Paenibacillus sp. FSL R7-0337]